MDATLNQVLVIVPSSYTILARDESEQWISILLYLTVKLQADTSRMDLC